MTVDWRLENLQRHPLLKGARLQCMAYRARPDWDHDHCAGCFAKFADEASGSEPILREGYTTGADYPRGAQYEWVCLECFAAFREAMDWSEIDA
jgi:hypothetical protein